MKISKVALEEHVAVPDTIEDSAKYFTAEEWPRMRHYLLDIHGQMLADMDAAGIETTILSLNSPAVQAIPNRKQAAEVARRGNDYLAEQIAKNPKRFQAFAALPMQDPDAAAAELGRCVKQLGFKGALVNSFSQVDLDDSAVYYDLPQYWDFWGVVESLGVPFYLHPRDPLESRTSFLSGHPWLRGSVWAFTIDTATHALRLMASGLFDKYPKLTIILGHLGETLPFLQWRIDNRLSVTPRGIPAKRNLGYYLRNNFFVTTSGNFCTQTLIDSILWLGADRILFSADYPFEKMSDAARWFDGIDAISDADKLKIGRTNAEQLLNLAMTKPQAASA